MNAITFVLVCVGAFLWVGWPGVVIAAVAALTEVLTRSSRT